jgi:hypothetical protein
VSGPQDELNRIQAKIEFITGRTKASNGKLNLQDAFDLHALQIEGLYLRLDNHSAKIRDLEEEVKTLKEKNHAGE